MPNWCINRLESLDGTNLKEKLASFLDEDGDIDFNKITPCPPEYFNTDKWYWWCVENWGTKWSSDSCSFSDDGQTVVFSTAWAPPIPIVEKVAKMLNCDLRMLYSEPGMDFHGEFQWFKDGFSADDCYAYHELPAELKEELADCFGLNENEEECS